MTWGFFTSKRKLRRARQTLFYLFSGSFSFSREIDIFWFRDIDIEHYVEVKYCFLLISMYFLWFIKWLDKFYEESCLAFYRRHTIALQILFSFARKRNRQNNPQISYFRVLMEMQSFIQLFFGAKNPKQNEAHYIITSAK